MKNLFIILAILNSFILFGCKDLWVNDVSVSSDDVVAALNELSSDYDLTTNVDSITYIHCNGNSFVVEGRDSVVSIKSSGVRCEITDAGVYYIDGTLSDGQIQVDAEDCLVKIVLNGVSLNCSYEAALRVKTSQKTILFIADDTENTIADLSSNEDAGALYSKSNLFITGCQKNTGTLSVVGNCADGIVSTDGLIIKSGNITVSAADDAIRGKDFLIIHDANISVFAKGDGLKSTNTTSGYGFVEIDNGSFVLDCSDEGIQAEGEIVIHDGIFTITNCDKCIASLGNITINGGDFTLTPVAIQSGSESGNGHGITTKKNDNNLRTGNVTINGGKINITQSYEGIQGVVITVNDGQLWVNSLDDAFNASNGSATMGWGGSSSSNGMALIVNGGFIYVVAKGDGLDSNGSMVFNGGVVLVSQNSSNNEPLDAGDGYSPTIKGGVVVAVGSKGMASAPSVSQTAFFVSASGSANSYFAVNDANGNNILAWKVPQTYQIATVSAPELGSATYTYITNASVVGQEFVEGSGFYYPSESCSGSGSSITTTTGSCTSNASSSGGMMPGGNTGGSSNGGSAGGNGRGM